MRLISWNVNGLRACIGKGFYDFAQSVEADIISVQETKMQPGQAAVELPSSFGTARSARDTVARWFLAGRSRKV